MRPRGTPDGLEEHFRRSRAAFSSLLAKYEIETPWCRSDVGIGWLPVLDEAFEKMIEEGWNRKLSQVKQKFNQLRIYLDDTPEYEIINDEFVRGPDGSPILTPIGKIIAEACDRCDRICELCGNERRRKGLGVGMALCDDCGKEET